MPQQVALCKPQVAHRQLCMIAKTILQTDLTIADGEWKQRIKDRLQKLGFAYPQDPGAIVRAMNAVERVVQRPLPDLPHKTATVDPIRQADPPWQGYRRRTSAEFQSLRGILENLAPLLPSEPPSDT